MHSLRLLVLSAWVWVACFPRGDKPAVIVNGVVIRREEFETELHRVRGETGDAILRDEVLSALKASVLNQLIERRLVLDQAMAYGISVSEGTVDAEIRRLQADYPEKGFERAMKANYVDLSEWRRRLKEKLIIERTVEAALVNEVQVTEDEVLRYYRNHGGEFSQPERVRARHIVVRTRDEAEVLRARILAGERFEDLARAHSLSPEKEQGGDLGVFAKGEMPPEFNQAFSLAVGQVSPVIESPYGFHLLVVTEKLPARIPTFEEVREEVRRRYEQERREAAYQEWLKRLRSESTIRIYQDVIDDIH